MAAAPLSRLIYASRAAVPFGRGDLAGLVRRARAANHGCGITGVLVHDDDRFLQVLEGPAPQVARLTARIAADPRHTDFDVLSDQTGIRRAFSGWDMQLALRGPGGPAEVLGPTHPPGGLFVALHGASDRLPALLSALAAEARSGADRIFAEDAALPGQLLARLAAGMRAVPDAARLDALIGGAAAGAHAAAARIEAAAGALGRMWRDDRCSGADLAAGLAILQGALRRLNLGRAAAPARPGAEAGHVSVALTPGEPHLIGALLKADLLRAAGWHVTLHLPATPRALAETVARLRPDGLIVASSRALPRAEALPRMADAIGAARRAAGRSRFFVAAGGLDFAQGVPAAAVGADIVLRAASDVAGLLAGFARPGAAARCPG